MKFNYSQICRELLRDLSQRQKEIILRRFALSAQAPSEGGVKGETLESIGKSYGITRERVRQIEKEGFLNLEPKIEQYQKIFQYFNKYLEAKGGLKKEDILLNDLASPNHRSQIYFLLTLGPNFERFGEAEDFYSLWTINQNSLVLAKKVIDSFSNKLREVHQPLPLKSFNPPFSLTLPALTSYLEISKKIQQSPGKLFGLRDWPEINPRGIKDKAYLVFKKEKRPLHFSEVAKLLNGSLVQTVHNELIRDPRFILVGRGIYALGEWGYSPGQVKEVIFAILKEERRPLTKEEILEKVLKQRLVKENTILLNLSNKKYFERDVQGKYKINPVREA